MLCSMFPLIFLANVDSARILGLFLAPSISHHVVFNAYVEELLKYGHEVVVITPNPAFPKNRLPDNLTEIDVSSVYSIKKLTIMEPLQQVAKRGFITHVNVMFEVKVYTSLIYAIIEILKNPDVKRIIDNKDQHFDLIVFEALTSLHLIVSKIFNAPAIMLSSFYGIPESFNIMGAPSVHPTLYPSIFRSKYRDLTLYDKIYEVYQEWKKLRGIENLENKLLEINYGPTAPTVDELKNNVAMLFLNSHPLFAGNRPVPPSVVYLGAIHLQPVKELPQDLKMYLDSSKRGVVYASLGSNINTAKMHKDMLEAFLGAFEALPYDILWKYDGDKLDNMPKNLKIQKWFPQRDLLAHPNVKVFITQGGLQSTDEAIDAGVPLVAIPMLGDQWWNTDRYVELGIGLKLDALTLSAVDLVNAVKAVIGNDSYKQNITKLRSLNYDQPQSPLERAVWWTEHVLRHGGATHLRAPGANMSWSEFLMIDVLVAILVIIFVVLLLLIIIVHLTVQSVCKLIIKRAKIKLV